MKSVWVETSALPSFKPLEQDLSTDVLIIGGGMAGLLTAHMLKKSGVDYALVEAKTICSGVTKNTTAKITAQHGLIYSDLIRRFGADKAKLYLVANAEAGDKYNALCQTIDCDFERKDAFVYSLSGTRVLDDELAALNTLGYHAESVRSLNLPFATAGAVKFSGQAQFNPLKFAADIAKGLNIYEHTKVQELVQTTALTDKGKITAKKIIIATHFPFINKHGSYFIKMYQHRSYAIALQNAPNVGGMYLDEAQKGMSFRNYRDLLIIGGGDHRTGKKGGCWQELESFAHKYYPQAQIISHWATQDCMTLDGVPYIGQYSKATPELFVATGFNKWGMSTAMVAADVLTDMVQGRKNRFAELFSPSRTILRPQLAINAFETTVSLLTPTTKRCPHLGCALKWNAQEHSWDCPCHGSRFTSEGELIDNPATDDLK